VPESVRKPQGEALREPVRIDLSADVCEGAAYPAGTKVGLVSDSHGHAERTRKAVDLLVGQGAGVLLHLGDVCCMTVLDALTGLEGRCDVRVVFGNCDHDWRGLAEYARFLGIKVDHPAGRIRIGQDHIVFAHGDDEAHYRGALREGVRYFCHGHTHEARDLRENVTRVINPGALHRSASYTVALLEPATDRLVWIPVHGE